MEVLPGRLCDRDEQVGRHIAPSPDEFASWMARFDACAPESFGRAERLVASAAAHHRLLWIHPFADRNGRVARLLSHALPRMLVVAPGVRSRRVTRRLIQQPLVRRRMLH